MQQYTLKAAIAKINGIINIGSKASNDINFVVPPLPLSHGSLILS